MKYVLLYYYPYDGAYVEDFETEELARERIAEVGLKNATCFRLLEVGRELDINKNDP